MPFVLVWTTKTRSLLSSKFYPEWNASMQHKEKIGYKMKGLCLALYLQFAKIKNMYQEWVWATDEKLDLKSYPLHNHVYKWTVSDQTIERITRALSFGPLTWTQSTLKHIFLFACLTVLNLNSGASKASHELNLLALSNFISHCALGSQRLISPTHTF